MQLMLLRYVNIENEAHVVNVKVSILFRDAPIIGHLQDTAVQINFHCIAFPFAAVRIWNCLLLHVTSAQSLPVFHSCLKTYLFGRCFP